MKPRRHDARVVALQALYEWDTVGHDIGSALARQLGRWQFSAEIQALAQELVQGVVSHQGEMDEIIKRFAPVYPVAQLSPIDRNILRLAIFEILYHNKAQVKVAINEAVELAKEFGSDSSSKFINGVLGSVVSELLTGPTPN